MTLVHKVKESKVKESKELSSEILVHWNEQKIIIHKKIDNITERKIFRTCEDYHINIIKKSISNYAEIVHSNDYFFNYKWTLKDFLQRGIDKFMDLEVAKSNYKNKPIENKKSHRQDVELTKEQKEVYR